MSARRRPARAGARWSARSRCARARACRTRSSAWATTWSASTSATTSSRACARWRPTWPSSPCTAATARTGSCRSCSRSLGIPYTASGVSACMRCSDKVVAKHAMRDAGLPTPDFYAFTETAFKELGAGDALGAIEERLRFPIVVKPADQGSALGIRFAATRRRRARRPSWPPSPTARRSCSSATCTAASWRSRSSATRRCRSSRRSRARRTSTTSPRATRSGARASSAPPSWATRLTARAQELALDVFRLLGCRGFARVDLMLEEGSDELYVLESNVIPGLTETSLLPQAAEAAGISLRRADRADRRPARSCRAAPRSRPRSPPG